MARKTATTAAAPSSGTGKAGAKPKPDAAAKPAAEDKKASTDGAAPGTPAAGPLASGDQKDSTAASGSTGGDGTDSTGSDTATGQVTGDGTAPGTAPGDGGQSLDTTLDTGEGAAPGNAPGDASGDGNQSLATGLDTATDPDNSLESGSGDAAGKSADLEPLEQANISAVQGETWTLPVLAEFPAVLTLTNAWPGQRHIVGTDETLAPGETRAIEFTEKAYTKFSRHIHQHASLHAWKHGEGLLIEQGAENGEG